MIRDHSFAAVQNIRPDLVHCKRKITHPPPESESVFRIKTIIIVQCSYDPSLAKTGMALAYKLV
jgi:hypothetical protein